MRQYDVPAGLLRAGRNVVALQVTHPRGPGGMMAEPDSVYLAGPGARIALAGEWRYRVEEAWSGGRRPDFVTGIPFEQQFLKYRNPVAGEDAAEGAPSRRRSGAGPRPDVTVALNPIPGQNRFDRTEIAVRAGQRIAIVFDNIDEMPHNVVVLQRGDDVEEVGRQLNAFVAEPGAAEADYVPPDLPVIAVGAMVDSRESGTLVFTAPDQPGEYPFVCTFPGHWLTMRGVLRVEADEPSAERGSARDARR